MALFQEHLSYADNLAHVIARRRCGGRSTGHCFQNLVDRLRSHAREGLFDAAKKFDPAQGIPFTSYANIRINGAVLDGMRSEAHLSRRTHERLSSGAGRHDHVASCLSAEADGIIAPLIEDEDGLTLLLAGGNAEDALVGVSLAQIVRDSVASLPPREAELIRRHYLEGERFDHVATELGLSKSWASRLHTRGLERLRKLCAQVEI